MIALSCQKFLLLLVLLTSCSAQSTYYVTPTPSTPCPGEPCHTLSQYVADQDFSNFPANTTVEFLPGNHTLNQTISVINLIWLTLHGDSSSLPEITSRIVCTWPAGFVFTGITELHITALAFISCGHTDSAAVKLISIQQSNISNCSFLNTYCCGGALDIQNSNCVLIGNRFLNNSAHNGGSLCFVVSNSIIGKPVQYNFTDIDRSGGALFVYGSTLNVINNTFQNNSALFGGALHVQSSTLNLTRNTFQTNCADFGGALYINQSSTDFNLTGNTFQNNTAEKGGGALILFNSTLTLTGTTFQYNSAEQGGALYVVSSRSRITGNTFKYSSANRGGALYVVSGTLNSTSNTFQNNTAANGGAVFVEAGTLNLASNIFQNNVLGGALYAESSILNLTDSTFQNNSGGRGGALCVLYSSILTLIGTTFQYNSAGTGGALFVGSSRSIITENTFGYNSADTEGGALFVQSSTLNLTRNTFLNNSADKGGGALSIVALSTFNLESNTFQNNYATELGGVVKIDTSIMNSTSNNFSWGFAEVGGIIAASKSYIIMHKNIIGNSRADYGGGIAALDSQMEFAGNNIFETNTAIYGGGLYVQNTIITGKVTLSNNSATEGGGGGYASNSTFYFTGNTTIMNNSAVDGGGLLLSSESQLYLQPNTHVYFTSNSAENTGGAIKVEEHNPLTYCILTSYSDSGCFFQIKNRSEHWNHVSVSEIKTIIDNLNVRIYFDNNSAKEAGADLHGGSVNNCTFSNIQTLSYECPWCPASGNVFDDIGIAINKLTPGISSDPLQVCTCGHFLTDCTGSYHHPEPVYPGGTLEVPVIAQGQRNGTTPAIIQVINTSESSITLPQNENIQNANNSCTTLKYTIQSFEENTTQNMTLYAEGPCSPTQDNTLTVTMDIRSCPPGFQLSENQSACKCVDRLQHFTDTCIIDNKTVLRRQGAEFWVGYDEKAHGVILHPHCPLDYCTKQEIYFRVDDSDKQCNYNRSSLLCGTCSKNLSLAFGSSRCLQCSNSHNALFVAFALAGLILVVLLLVLRLTVAAGTINGLIFYVNIVTVNSGIFFPTQTTNVLTVFIDWLNLDLGIEVCFYNGMDAYVITWLQFVFPIYIWVMVGIIIIYSHYSGRVARIFGSNPVAVLATLFLLSYAKLLRTVIATLSYTYLEYPNNSHIAVWLYDGNIRYLSGKHTPLFIAAMVCLILLFFPYTMLLLFSQWLQAKSRFKIFSCINNRYIKPFLDAYHAPYSNKHRYWTGLMLLLRLVLFLIPAEPNFDIRIVAIACATALILPTILGSKIYKSWSLGLLETSFTLNLTILAVATLYIRLNGGNQNAATFTSVGIAFATFIGIVIYHSIQQIKDTRLWKRVCLRHDYMRVPLTDHDPGPEDPPDVVFVSGSAPTQTVVDIRNSQLREPCMATD